MPSNSDPKAMIEDELSSEIPIEIRPDVTQWVRLLNELGTR